MSRPASQIYYDDATAYNAPPQPPPKQAGSIAYRAPPPLPPSVQNGISELPAEQVYAAQDTRPPHAVIESNWLPNGLLDKSTADLHQLLNDSSLQAALLNDPSMSHPAVAGSEAYLQPILQDNIVLATSLEQLGTRLADQRAAAQARLLALRALEQQHRTKISETEDALRDFSPGALYQRLNASALEQEQLVRGVEQSWIDEPGQASEREVSDWVRRVKDASREAFLKKEKKARWDEGRVGGWK